MSKWIAQACRTLRAGLAAAVALTASAVGAPEPSPTPLRWQLDVEPGELKAAFLDVPGVGPRAYLYMTYKVENNTGADMYFAPSFELSTDDGDLIRAGRDVPTEVNRMLLERLKNQFLKDQTDAIGTLRQGEENAREGLVVWPAPSLKVDRVTVYCVGFSGETKRVKKPAPTEPEAPAATPAGASGSKPTDTKPTDAKDEVVLRKTLMLVHTTPGEITGPQHAPLARTTSRWILR